MKMKIDVWESERDEMRKIPVVCPECEEQVQVSAHIKDGELVMDKCPACNTPIGAALYLDVEDEDSEEEAQIYPISAKVTWGVEGSVISERTTKFGPFLDIPSMLIRVLQDGIEFFRSPGLSGQMLYGILADFIVRNVLQPEQLREIMEICSERMKTPPDIEQFVVIKSHGGNGEVKTEDKEDEEDSDHDD